MAARNLKKTEKAAQEVKAAARDAGSQSPVEAALLDLAKLSNVKQFAADFRKKKLPLDILVANASAWMTPEDMSPTEDGFEYQTASFLFGHMYLVELLKDLLVSSAPSRLVWTTSAAESYGQIDWDDLKQATKSSNFKTYGTNKLMGMMCARELAHRLEGKVEVYAGHPGMSSTDFFNPDKFDTKKLAASAQWAVQKVVGLTPEQGAWPVIYCCLAASKDLHGVGDGTSYGPEYYSMGQNLLGGAPNITNKGLIREQEPQNPELKDAAACRKLYEKVLEILHDAPAADGI